MATAAITFELVRSGQTVVQTPAGPLRVLPIPWRDPHTVEPEQLAQYITMLERACVEHPNNADFRTCLGMAHAMNYDVYKSMDALKIATVIEPDHFWAQMKYAELYYRLRALSRAEAETSRALNLARNPIELAIARKQLLEVRRLRRESARDVAWTKPLMPPALVLSAMVLLTFVVMMWG